MPHGRSAPTSRPTCRTTWTRFLQFRLADLAADPAAQPWLGRAIVATDAVGRTIIGSVGFHAPPDATGRVEVGYHVEPGYRRQGVATEAVAALFDWAFREHGVHHFRAAVAPDNVASLAVLARFGFRQVGVQLDDIDGTELVFELDEWPPTSLTARMPSWPRCRRTTPMPLAAVHRSTRWPSTPARNPTS